MKLPVKFMSGNFKDVWEFEKNRGGAVKGVQDPKGSVAPQVDGLNIAQKVEWILGPVWMFPENLAPSGVQIPDS